MNIFLIKSKKCDYFAADKVIYLYELILNDGSVFFFLFFLPYKNSYERERFRDCISRYQAGSVNVQASLSFLNITQKLILQVCLALALGLSSMGISQRSDCCVAQGCSSGISDCCQAIDKATCPGMEVGDFVAVLSFTMQLFQPLNFLGSVYNAIVMAIVDLTNLSQLLAQSPDVIDAPDAMVLPRTNEDDDDIAVEFDNVFFHYPTQPASKGLKGVSFKMRRGTTTAIVGPTGVSVLSFPNTFKEGICDYLTLLNLIPNVFLSYIGRKDNYFTSFLQILRCIRWSCQD